MFALLQPHIKSFFSFPITREYNRSILPHVCSVIYNAIVPKNNTHTIKHTFRFPFWYTISSNYLFMENILHFYYISNSCVYTCVYWNYIIWSWLLLPAEYMIMNAYRVINDRHIEWTNQICYKRCSVDRIMCIDN